MKRRKISAGATNRKATDAVTLLVDHQRITFTRRDIGAIISGRRVFRKRGAEVVIGPQDARRIVAAAI